DPIVRVAVGPDVVGGRVVLLGVVDFRRTWIAADDDDVERHPDGRLHAVLDEPVPARANADARVAEQPGVTEDGCRNRRLGVGALARSHARSDMGGYLDRHDYSFVVERRLNTLIAAKS